MVSSFLDILRTAEVNSRVFRQVAVGVQASPAVESGVESSNASAPRHARRVMGPYGCLRNSHGYTFPLTIAFCLL